jgi:hypothetical protein
MIRGNNKSADYCEDKYECGKKLAYNVVFCTTDSRAGAEYCKLEVFIFSDVKVGLIVNICEDSAD